LVHRGLHREPVTPRPPAIRSPLRCPPAVAATGMPSPHPAPKTPGYCWPTPRCRNLCVQHAFFEGKKTEETSPRKSTPRTWKGVDQQYPPDCCTVWRVSRYLIKKCPETRDSGTVDVSPWSSMV